MSGCRTRFLNAALAAGLVLASGDRAGAASLVLHWKLDESSGATAADSAGTNVGTLVNMAGSEWTAGKVDGALGFPGAND